MPVVLILSVFVAAWFASWPEAWGYEERDVTDGGGLAGRVMLDGAPPPARIFHLVFSPNMEFCGRISDGRGNRLLREFTVADDGGFQGVVVAVVGVSAGKRFEYRPEIEIDHCRVAPFVTPVRNARPLAIVNRDSITHDIQAYSLAGEYTFAMFNKPMIPESLAAKIVRLRKGHFLFRTQCGVHDFMQSWGIAVGNPYFAVTEADGRYRIGDLPSGEYDVIAWHPHMKVQAHRVTIVSSKDAELNFRFDADEVDIPLHDLQTTYRLEPALMARSLPVPSIEHQTP